MRVCVCFFPSSLLYGRNADRCEYIYICLNNANSEEIVHKCINLIALSLVKIS